MLMQPLDVERRTTMSRAERVSRQVVMKQHVSARTPTPVGMLTLVASDEGLAAVLWENDRPNRVRLNIRGECPDHPVLVDTARQLAEYFARSRQRFTLALDMTGTPFQIEVWEALLKIPYGETRTYAEIARVIGRPSAVRAVGAANGRNPLSIVTPCHRVIGSSGALTGFAGGLDVKARLLAFEARDQRAPFSRSEMISR